MQLDRNSCWPIAMLSSQLSHVIMLCFGFISSINLIIQCLFGHHAVDKVLCQSQTIVFGCTTPGNASARYATFQWLMIMRVVTAP